jgi:hypothetical protein
MPVAPVGAVSGVIVCDVASYSHTKSPPDCDPTKRQPSFQHDEDWMYVDVLALGTVMVVQRPFVDRYSPTEVGLTSRLDVPIATQELSVVHATFESGTEILMAGRPSTCGVTVDVTVDVAHDANTRPATEQRAVIRTSERARAGTRIIVSLRS